MRAAVVVYVIRVSRHLDTIRSVRRRQSVEFLPQVWLLTGSLDAFFHPSFPVDQPSPCNQTPDTRCHVQPYVTGALGTRSASMAAVSSILLFVVKGSKRSSHALTAGYQNRGPGTRPGFRNSPIRIDVTTGRAEVRIFSVRQPSRCRHLFVFSIARQPPRSRRTKCASFLRADPLNGRSTGGLT